MPHRNTSRIRLKFSTLDAHVSNRSSEARRLGDLSHTNQPNLPREAVDAKL